MASLTSLTRSLGSLTLNGAASASSRHALRLPSASRSQPSSNFSLLAGSSSSSTASRPRIQAPTPTFTPSTTFQVRHKGNLAPRRVKYRKAHKGRVPVKTGGSIKGTTVQLGLYGIRVLEPARLTAKQLSSAETALKRRLKVIKGAQVFMRVFPDVPVCVKGNETRMGKGKGAFEFWACRAPVGRMIFEIGGPVEIRPEVAKEALRLASAKLPVRTEFVSLESNPRLGSILVERDDQPAASVISAPSSASALPTVVPTSVLGQAASRSTVAEAPLSQSGSPAGPGQL
ncbi:39S ribosomal protein L16, mitochondrial [Tilletia horrida]|uniref:39S ribosomal protein L16, mitochondrial n=1 Tax=Tilletia horrida TaxID=155126 RepID=A0AAN6GQJ8_9BASI|nr:39S ribosomal protein L16, mitochondrial [Tilletia horrida]KAK0569910.1 39S ribosomal protein L16, mitochondrial [Tilletia horrida]